MIVRPDGLVKVLDFGLAKLVQARESQTGSTRTAFQTDAGTVVGTLQYMSPEQARGETVDGRTDIWALGVILFEITTGRSPFAASNTSDVVAGILDRPAPPIAHFDPSAPPELQRIINKTLRKNPAQRYQSIEDLRLDLEVLRDDIEGRVGSPDAQERRPELNEQTPGVKSRLRSRAALAAVALAIVVTGALVAWWLLKWAVRFDAARGRPIGEPFMITRFDSPGRTISPRMGNTDIGIAAGRALLTLETVTGTIWMLDHMDK